MTGSAPSVTGSVRSSSACHWFGSPFVRLLPREYPRRVGSSASPACPAYGRRGATSLGELYRRARARPRRRRYGPRSPTRAQLALRKYSTEVRVRFFSAPPVRPRPGLAARGGGGPRPAHRRASLGRDCEIGLRFFWATWGKSSKSPFSLRDANFSVLAGTLRKNSCTHREIFTGESLRGFAPQQSGSVSRFRQRAAAADSRRADRTAFEDRVVWRAAGARRLG